jgi:transcription initiation factor TFIID subunit TAF12
MNEIKIDIKKVGQNLPNFGRRMLAIASARKIQSSGYGKIEAQQKLFQPRINRRRSQSSNQLQIRAWESNDGNIYFLNG